MEKNQFLLNKSIKDVRDEIELSEKRISCDIKEIKVNLSDRIGVFEKYRWIIIGGAIVLGLWAPEVLDLTWLLKQLDKHYGLLYNVYI